jgi:hypothetical protein
LIDGEVLEPDAPLLTPQIREQPPVHGLDRPSDLGRDLFEDGIPVKRCSRSACLGGGQEGSLSQLVRLLLGIDLKFAAVFQKLGQPLMDELGRIVADRLQDFFLHLPTGLALHLPEDFQEALGHRSPVSVCEVQISRDQAVT